MTTTPVNLIYGPGATQWDTGTPPPYAYALNDADDAAAWIFNVPKSGTITKIGAYFTAVAGSPPAYNAGIVTLDASQRPTTSNYGGSAAATVTPSAAGLIWIDLATAATASAGDFAAVYIWPTGTAPDGTNYATIQAGPVWLSEGFSAYYSTGWVITSRGPTFAIQYDDGTIYGFAAGATANYRDIRSDSDPDEYGNKFTPPAAMTAAGAVIWHAKSYTGASATYTVTLYDSADNVLASVSISDKDQIDDLDTIAVYWTPVTLSAGSAYRITVTPAVAGTGGRIYLLRALFDSADAMAALPNNAGAVATYRTDGGSWTDATAEIAAIGLIVTEIDFGGGGSGGGSGEYVYIG